MRIVVYSASWCVNCARLKKYLDTVGIPFEVVDTDSDEGMELARANNVHSLPTTFIYDDGVIIQRLVGLFKISDIEK